MNTGRRPQGSVPKRIYLIAPRNARNFWSMEGTAHLFGAKALMPPAALATLMALTPEDLPIQYVLCDENTDSIDWNLPCDLVAITGYTLHSERIQELCRDFAMREIPVALGGTYASICPEQCGELADYLFIGEAEHTWPRFLREWMAGKARPLYHQQEHVDLSDSPPPDWSLINHKHYLEIPVQTTRGCPHNCDYCDVVPLMGRRVRTKSVSQVMTELQHIEAMGAHSVFFSDDNFIGKPKFTRELVQALVEWNTTLAHPLSFSTQITLQVADDEDLLKSMADARFGVLFLGVETVRRDSLAEVHKAHNLNKDPVERIRRLSRYGLVPFIGLMVGFDHDDKQVFGELEQFMEESRAPITGISLVNAPRNTPLYHRLEQEGRIRGGDFSGEWQLGSNVIPKLMTTEELEQGYWDLFVRLYEPESFEERLREWLLQVDYFTPLYTKKKKDLSQIGHIMAVMKYLLFEAPPDVRAMIWRNIKWTWHHNPKQMRRVFTFLGQYKHFYHFIAEVEAERKDLQTIPS